MRVNMAAKIIVLISLQILMGGVCLLAKPVCSTLAECETAWQYADSLTKTRIINAATTFNSAAVPLLITALKDPESVVRRNADGALRSLGPMAKDAIPDLINTFRDAWFEDKPDAAITLGKIGPDAVPALIDALRDENWTVRRGAAIALGEIGPEAKEAVPTLIGALKDEPHVRLVAAVALGEMGAAAKDAVPAMIDVLTGAYFSIPPPKGLMEPLKKLGLLAIPALKESLNSPDRLIRVFVAEALGELGSASKDAVPALIRALKDDDQQVRENAAESLGKIGLEGEKSIPALIDVLNDNRYAGAALVKLGKRSVPFLLNALKNADVKCEAVHALGEIGSEAKDAVSDLIEMLGDTEYCIKRNAAVALAKISPTSPGVVPALISLLADGSVGAIEALGEMGPNAKDAVPALVKTLKDVDFSARLAIIEALGKIGPAADEAAATLGNMLGDESRDIRISAGKALGRMGPAAKDAAPAIISALKDSDLELSVGLKDLLKKMGPAAVPALIDALKNVDGDVKYRAIEVLGEIGPDAVEAIPSLEAIRKYNESFRNVAAEAISGIQARPVKKKISMESHSRTDSSVAGDVGGGKSVRAIKTRFVLRAKTASNVFLAGTFTSWGNREMTRNDDVWEVWVYILPGTYKYYFVVDGEIVPDPGKPIASDGKSLLTVGN